MAYKGGIINLKIGLVTLNIKGRIIIMNFNILLFENNKVDLGMLSYKNIILKLIEL